MEGSFVLRNVPPGDYYVVAVLPGYVSADEYIYPGAMSPEIGGSKDPLPLFVKRVAVAPGGAARVEIRLQRGGSIGGSVKYSDGAAATDVALTLKVKLNNGDFADTMGTGAMHTDSSGLYRFDGLAGGAYIVTAALPGEMIPVLGGAQLGSGGPIVFSGSKYRPSEAQVIVLDGAGGFGEANIAIPLTGMHVVSGVAIAAGDGHALNHGLLRLYPKGEPRPSRSAPLRADGTFSFKFVAPGTYTISLEEAADWKLVPVNSGQFTYQRAEPQRTYGNTSTDVIVADADVSNVTLRAGGAAQ